MGLLIIEQGMINSFDAKDHLIAGEQSSTSTRDRAIKPSS
jgi:hypothetical protein